MRLIRTDLATGKRRMVARWSGVSNHTAHAFMVQEAQREAQTKGCNVATAGGPLSGCSTAKLIDAHGHEVAEYTQLWTS